MYVDMLKSIHTYIKKESNKLLVSVNRALALNLLRPIQNCTNFY